jgi:hypothetical protein
MDKTTADPNATRPELRGLESSSEQLLPAPRPHFLAMHYPPVSRVG